MIEMQVIGIALDTKSGSPIIVLSDIENRKALPIWVGSAEASSIIRHMENIQAERPMTHDLICNILKELDYKLDKIEINDVNSSTFYANIFLSNADGKKYIIDSRPSDAISIALRTKSPIFVAPNVLIEGAVSTNREKDKKEDDEFKEFLKDLKPSDFKKIFDDNKESNQ